MRKTEARFLDHIHALEAKTRTPNGSIARGYLQGARSPGPGAGVGWGAGTKERGL